MLTFSPSTLVIWIERSVKAVILPNIGIFRPSPVPCVSGPCSCPTARRTDRPCTHASASPSTTAGKFTRKQRDLIGYFSVSASVMDATCSGGVSREGCCSNLGREPSAVKQSFSQSGAPNAAWRSRWDDRRASTFPKLSSSSLRLSRWNFPKNEAKVPVQRLHKSCSLVGPKIPFPVNRHPFALSDLGVTY
jgi:hypothetical protein